ncbi:MAG: methyltransferase domain-containing protein [Chitinispirillaceae bacterium]|nr:methyltransferase domain-containing protein [Chitinispirillaceae bacterium]
MGWTKKDIIDYYKENELAYWLWGKNMHYGYWEEGVKTQRQASEKFNEVMANLVGISRNDWVLDAGCGVGGSSIYLAKNRGCRVTGITICSNQVSLAYKNAKKEGVSHLVEFFEMDYLKTGFKDNTFNVVWGLESICYAESKEKFIKEASRVLKNEGRVIVADGFASKESYVGKEKWLMQRWLDGWVVNFLNTPSQFKRFALNSGFKRVEYYNVTDKVFKTSKLMFYVSLLFLPLHLLDRIKRIKSYPTDALFNQYFALKRGLWEYGIFIAFK